MSTQITSPIDNLLVRFSWDYGRMGKVRGMFITTRAELEAGYGQRVNFGEALGKHSDVSGELSEGDIQIVTDDQEFLAKMEAYTGRNVSGYNPFDYMDMD